MQKYLSHLRRIAALLGVTLLLGSSPMTFAEQFLTVEEAQKILIPKATTFEPRIVRFTSPEVKAIASKIEAKVRHKGHRIWTALHGDELLGVLVLDHVLGKHQLIDYVVAISPTGQVMGIEILEYRESYGGEIRQKKWREQFLGKTTESDLQLNENIYNISGATISCRNVTEGTRRVLATFEMVIRPRLVDDFDLMPKPTSDQPD